MSHKLVSLYIEDGEYYTRIDVDAVIAELEEKLKEQTSIAEEGWKEFRTYHTSYAEAVKELYDKNKEIAELKADYKEAIDRLQTANLIKDEQLAATRHSKRKRCLNKAELCELRYYRTKDLHRTKDIEDKYYMGSPLFKKRLFKLWFYEKWTNKWLELAEQFKEGV